MFMDVNGIVQVIQTVGFPIAMCLTLAWYVKYQQDENKKTLENLTTVLNNNTIALTKISEKLEGMNNERTTQNG